MVRERHNPIVMLFDQKMANYRPETGQYLVTEHWLFKRRRVWAVKGQFMGTRWPLRGQSQGQLISCSKPYGFGWTSSTEAASAVAVE